MKILVAAAAFSPEMSGVQRHAFNLVRCLLRCPEITSVHLAIAPWQSRLVASSGLVTGERLRIDVAEMDRGSLSRNLWYYRGLPALARAEHADLVHLAYPVPVNASAYSCPVVVTLHDLYPYEIPLNFGLRQIVFNRAILQQCLRGVDAIACVSQTTRQRLRQFAPARVWRKAVRIYNCVELVATSSPHSPIPGWQGEPFLLCVAQHRRNKNIPFLLRVFAGLLRNPETPQGLQLVIVGIRGPETSRILRCISRLRLQQHVHLLEGLSDAELQWCYTHCELLAAPSLTEGFGLPVAEALLAGCRVVCSSIAAFREIGGSHCRYVPLEKDGETAFAAAIAQALRAPSTPPVSLPQLSSRVLARQYIDLYRGLTPSSPSIPHLPASARLHVMASGRHSA
jgi:glycosyltransferase involved in cell wall biosynthesis